MTESTFRTTCNSATPINPVPFHRNELRYKGSINATILDLLQLFGQPILHKKYESDSSHFGEISFFEWEVGFLNIYIQPYMTEFDIKEDMSNMTTAFNWIVLARPEDFMAIDDLKKFLNFVNGLGNKDHLINGSPAATVSVRDLNDTVKK